MTELTTKQLQFLLSELDRLFPIVPISDKEANELEASYVPPDATPEQLARDAKFLEWFLQECIDTGVPSS